jgi:hypothetical protein
MVEKEVQNFKAWGLPNFQQERILFLRNAHCGISEPQGLEDSTSFQRERSKSPATGSD